ncbi:uncharacterized protein LOC108483946 isoform X2 [Gossypium arboreum]|uniref:uncharacterized protein LOC108483946 isoform X2 n=1 Tax=Gossypium arboreum TaxID=29729 RepID=UPI000819620B|nr:uncharacterized protein LOC108483946 isoform X2 [Gossypium arboreum]
MYPSNILHVELNSLRMDCLRNLIFFCSRNFNIEFPFLKELMIEDCPKLKEFISKSSTESGMHTLFNEKWNCCINGNEICRQYCEGLFYFSGNASHCRCFSVSVRLQSYPCFLPRQVIEIPFNNFLYCWNKS